MSTGVIFGCIAIYLILGTAIYASVLCAPKGDDEDFELIWP